MDQSAPRSPARRQFLRTAAGASAGMASWLALRTPPAVAQKRELTFLSWNHFVPAADDELKRQAEAFSKANNCTVRVDTMAHLQMPAKVAAEAQSQSGHDMYRSAGADPFLYEHLHASVDDIVEKLGKQYGGWYPFCAQMCQTTAGWKAVPWFWVSFPATYNMAHFKKAGFGDSYPKTWAELLSMGKVLKKQGNPVGIPISHCSDAQHHLLVGLVVVRRQGDRGRRQDARASTRTRPRRSSSGTRSSTRTPWSRRSCPGTTRATTASSSPARARGSTIPSAPTTRRCRRRCRSPTTSTTTTAPRGRRAPTPRRPILSIGDLEVLQEPGAGQGVHPVPLQEGELRRVDRGLQRLQSPAGAALRRSPDLGEEPEVRHAAQGGRFRASARLAGQAERRRAAHRRQLRPGRHGGQGRERHADQARHGVGARSRSPCALKGQLKVG